jgi:alpha-glucosidase
MDVNHAGVYRWWQSGVIYQVYPRSFKDSNGDGIGDVKGIATKLPYLKWLGVDAIWLSPIYPSPMKDFGYDITDYHAIDPVFGTMKDFEDLVATAHELGLKVILDFVPNHTSDQHPWFQNSRSSRNSDKRDWYIWRDPAPGGGPPNNWLSIFGGSAWEWDKGSRQYYYHAFLKEQPDLNWRNPEVQEAVFDAMRFWLDKGIDGFRVDVIWHLVKDAEFRDNPPNPQYQPGQPSYFQLEATFSADRPEVHDIIAGMRQVVEAYGDKLLIGEIYLPVDRLVTYYGAGGSGGVHLPFNFQLLLIPWNAQSVAEVVELYESSLPPLAWPNWVLSNHDRPRVATRVGREQARVAAMLLLTLRGTPTIYYGDEIGMQDVPIPPERVQDPVESMIPGRGRDPQRTPMQWNADESYAGFSTFEPWLPISDDYKQVNVEVQSKRQDGILLLYRKLLSLWRNEPALSVGSFRSIGADEGVMAFIREQDQTRWLVVLNLSGEARRFNLPRQARHGRVFLSTHLDERQDVIEGVAHLRANEGILVRLTGNCRARCTP